MDRTAALVAVLLAIILAALVGGTSSKTQSDELRRQGNVLEQITSPSDETARRRKEVTDKYK